MKPEELQYAILLQEKKITNLEAESQKLRTMTKYRHEHLARLDKKQESLFEESKSLADKKKVIEKEFSSIENPISQAQKIQVEYDKAVRIEFVKKSPLDGVNFLIDELEEIKESLLESKSEDKHFQKYAEILEVQFRDEKCYIRATNQKYTFGELASDAAMYFNLVPEDCLVRDENGAIWPSNSSIVEEFDSTSHKLILGLKYGRVARNPHASEINWQEMAAQVKLETRLQRMAQWVIEKGKTGQKRGIKEESILKALLYFVLYTTFLCLLYYFVFAPISLRDAYQLNNSISNMFVYQGFPQDCRYQNGLSTSFIEINKPEQFFCWFDSVLVGQLFDNQDVDVNNNNTFILRYNQLGGIRIKQSRVKEKSCVAINYKTGEINEIQECYSEYSYNMRSKDDFGPAANLSLECSGLDCNYAQAFKYTESPPNGYAFTGEVATYDMSGFYIDSENIQVDGKLNQDAFSELGLYLQNNMWIDVKTRAILIIFSFYNINYNYFSSLELLIEVSGTGYLNTKAKLNTLDLNFYYQSWNKMKNSSQDFFDKFPELYCYIYTVLGVFTTIILRLKKNYAEYLRQMWSYLDMVLFILMIGIISMRVVLYFVCDSILTSIGNKSFNKFTNFSTINYYLSISWGLEAFCVLAASLKFLNYFTIQSMTIIWDTLDRGAKSIFAFFVIFIVLMCSFTQMVHVVYGTELQAFNSFSKCISSLFMILLGALDNYPGMSQASPYFTPIFFIVFMFLMFFVVMNIFVAILNEAFGVVVEVETKSHEKELVGRFKNRLVKELKFYGERVKYVFKKAFKSRRVPRSAAFKAFNRT